MTDPQIDLGDKAFLYLNLHPNEEIKLIVRHHWFGFVGTILIAVAIGVFPALLLLGMWLVMPTAITDNWQLIVMGLAAYYIFVLTFLFGAWINYYYDIIFVTSERIINIAQEGLLARKTSELSLKEVQDVSAEVNGFFRTSFNYGLLVVETAGDDTSEHRGGHGYFTIEDIPDPARVARTILELHRNVESGA